jgi:type IV secretory pathway TrbD component
MKPSEFFVGVIDFFAILLPGAIATAVLAPRVGPALLGPLFAAPKSDAESWAMFGVSAYFLGHLIFLVGSYIDPLYNAVRQRREPYDNESAFSAAERVRDALVDAAERKALNPFQWSRSVLLAVCPAAAEDVHRLEADSKFFRSLLVVCLLAAAVLVGSDRPAAALVACALVVPCFARYYERRLKSTTQAYQHVVTLYRLGRLGAPKPPAAPAGSGAAPA